MGDADVTACNWKLVEVGRVVLFAKGPYEGLLAAVVEIIDHKRVLVDGPSSDPAKVVPRHAIRLADVTLTPIVVEKLPRAARNGKVRKEWEASKVEESWNNTAWAKNRASVMKRRNLNDFERFKLMRLKKMQSFEVKKAMAKAKAA
ncbi:60S ribosomal protein L14 [Lineolata rhizophorae]|uniref:60S ribosomal protein L14 n=1 Tax=Lineolata rhizophorae TaxID=578093 RepID=A0A6A6P3K0_9PEZI|nr:60S ribosomal protein L14 [Lineolata rhizophorae]